MKILHVSHQYSPAVGGSEQYITKISEELVCRGHTVDVFTSQSIDYRTWANSLPKISFINGVFIRRFGSLKRNKYTWKILRTGIDGYRRRPSKVFQPLVWCGNGPVTPSMYSALLKQVQSYDVCHINQLHYAHSWLASVISSWKRTPIVLTPHIHPEQKDTFDFPYLQNILKRSSVNIAVTEPERSFLKSLVPRSDVVLGGNGLCLESYPEMDSTASREKLRIPKNAFVMLFLGRKTEYKGLETCFAAYSRLRTCIPSIVFIAAGPETEYSKSMWKKSPNPPSLIVLDRIPEEQKQIVLASADVLILPSKGEAFGIVYLEAWAHRKPVIGANIPSVASVIDQGKNGFIVSPDDVDAMVDRLLILARNPELSRRLGQNGREKLEERFTVQAITDVVEGTYQRLRRKKCSLYSSRSNR